MGEGAGSEQPGAVLRPAARLAAVLGSGALYGLAFPPLRLEPVAWVAVAPLLLGLRGARTGETLWLMWVWTIAASAASGHWLPGAVEVYYLQPAWVGWAFFLGIASLNAAPYYLPLGLVLRRLSPGGRATEPLVIAAAWVTAELARGRLLNDLGVFISNPWAQLGYSQAAEPRLVQIASLTGIYGVTFALVACGATVAALVVRATRPGARWRSWLLVAVAGLAPGLALQIFGAAVLSSAPDEDEPVDGATVVVVQAAIPWDARWRPELYGSNLETYLELTKEALAGTPADVVVWPESAMAFFVELEPAYRRSIAEALGPAGPELLAGGVRVEPEGSPRYFNTFFAIDEKGEIRSWVDKEKLVPFGEYFPFRTIAFLRRRFARVRYYEPGEPRAVLETRIGPAVVATCNEAMLPELVARRVLAGGTWIVNPSNDAWAPVPVFAEQMLDMARVRAIEQRRWLVRASTTGPSAFVDPWGRVRASAPLNRRGVITGVVEARDEMTPYARVGDCFAVGCAIATGFLLARVPTARS